MDTKTNPMAEFPFHWPPKPFRWVIKACLPLEQHSFVPVRKAHHQQKGESAKSRSV